jgi:cytochrome c553
MLPKIKSITRNAVALLIMSTAFSVAQADDHDAQKRTADNARWKSECSGCHVAYPPGMLPAGSWRAIMAGLDKHFGSDASMDTASLKEIETFLEENASTRKYKTAGKPLLRITETRSFKSEHGELAASVWKNPKVKSPANCGACHTKADSGEFNEDDVNIPK